MNKLSTEVESFVMHIGAKEAIKLAKNAGFDCYNFDLCHICDYDFKNDKANKIKHPLSSGKYKKYLLDIKKHSDELGIVCNQTHAPFPIHVKEILRAQKKAVIATSLLGAKIMVVHPDTFKSVDENVKVLKKIVKFAKKYNIKIAIENAWNWSGTHAIYCAGSTPESLLAIINKINEENVGACLDIGHADIMGELCNSIDFIETLKDKLIATHLHDNDLKNDKHQILFSGSMKLENIAMAFKNNGYKGELTLESIYYFKPNLGKDQEMMNDLYNSLIKFKKIME